MLVDHRNATLREYCDHVSEVVDSYALREGWVGGLLTEAFTGKSFESMVNQLAKIESMIPEEMENTLRALQRAIDKAEKDYVNLIRRRLSREEFTRMVAQTKGLADGLSKAIKELQIVLRSRQIKNRVNARLGGDDRADGETLGDVLDDNHKEILKARLETAFTRPEGMLGRLWKALSPQSYGWHGLTDEQLLEDMLNLNRDGVTSLGDISPDAVDDLFPPAVDKAVEDEAEQELEEIDPEAAAKARKHRSASAKKKTNEDEPEDERSPGDDLDPEEEQNIPVQRMRRPQTPSQKAKADARRKAKKTDEPLPPARRPQPKREKVKLLPDEDEEYEPEASASSVAVEDPEPESEEEEEEEVSGEIDHSNRSPEPAPVRRQRRYEPDDDDWAVNPPDADNREVTPAKTSSSQADQDTQPIAPKRRRVPLRKPPEDNEDMNQALDASLARLGIDTGQHQRQSLNRDEEEEQDDVETRSMLDPESDEDYQDIDVRDFASNINDYDPIPQPPDDDDYNSDDPQDFEEYPQSDMEYLGHDDEADPIPVGDEEDYEGGYGGRPRFQDPIPVKAYQDRWGRRTDVTDPGPSKHRKSTSYGDEGFDERQINFDDEDLAEDDSSVTRQAGKTMVPRDEDVTGRTILSDPNASEDDDDDGGPGSGFPDNPSLDPYQDEPASEDSKVSDEIISDEPQGPQTGEQTPEPQLAKEKPKLSLQRFLDEYLPDGGRNLSKQNIAGLAKLLRNRGFDVEMPDKAKAKKQKKAEVAKESVDPTLERWRRLAGIPREMK